MNKHILDNYTKLNLPELNQDNTEQVNAALVDHVYKNTMLGLMTSSLCAMVMTVGIYANQNKIVIISWFVLFTIVTLVRFTILHLYQKYQFSEKNSQFWENLFTFGTILSGITWGLTASVLFPLSKEIDQVLIISILAGVTAGAVPLLAGILSASISFLMLALTPLLFSLLLSHNHAYVFFDIAAIAYTMYLIALTFTTHRMIKGAIKLQFENDALLKDIIKAKIKLEHTATHDPLTNMANRNLFTLSFEDAIKRAERHGTLLGLLYLDIDNFKEVNDLYGHDVGDILLLNTVERLKNILRDTDLVSRLGGDEFTILLEDIKQTDAIIDIARKICQSFASPMTINDHEINVTVSIGISIYPLDEQNASKLLKIADNAMYYAKKQGQNNFHRINNHRHYTY